MTTTRLYTAEDLEAMAKEAPYIIIDGQLVYAELRAGGRASRAAALVATYLCSYARPRRLGEVLGAAGAFVLQRNPDTVLIPDASFIRADRLPPGDDTKFVPVAPDIAVEVLSPSNRPPELQRKIDRYLRAGTPLVWVVDPDADTVTIHAAEVAPRTLGVTDTLDGGEVLPGFALPLAELFA